MNQKYTGAKNLNHQHQIDLMIHVIMAGDQDLEKNREHIGEDNQCHNTRIQDHMLKDPLEDHVLDLEQNQSQEKECIATK